MNVVETYTKMAFNQIFLNGLFFFAVQILISMNFINQAHFGM